MIYLDWAVNKDRRGPALAFLDDVQEFLIGSGPGDRIAEAVPGQYARTLEIDEAALGPPDVEVAIAYTEKMRCKPAFRPRMEIGDYLYVTFWTLWNETVRVVGGEEPETVESIAEDLQTQLNYYDEHGIGMRGGVAPIVAGRIGAGKRLRDEIGATAGLTGEDLMDLSEEDRDAIIEADAERRIATTRAHADPAYGEHLASLVEDWNDLWGGEANPLLRDESGEPNELELTIIKKVAFEMTMAHATSAGVDPDADQMQREVGLGCYAMAGGYLWREAELRRVTGEPPPIPTIADALEFASERQAEDDATPELLKRAIFMVTGGDGAIGFSSLIRTTTRESSWKTASALSWTTSAISRRYEPMSCRGTDRNCGSCSSPAWPCANWSHSSTDPTSPVGDPQRQEVCRAGAPRFVDPRGTPAP
jgi:hypothetical protein